ncbi:efflux RND transporter periplasmic adaptor subunit [uncultured Tepidimonas sp.]|uniref:efflux RND transporter periplasmic adaptor subunit n=1 Tax=uncultured Tepidimonas sp. TaxID=453579 RepID=UPI002602EC16|nr:efflux RND transporter periplasmic adaptor subunit [uncultured Tepidimonas sp.]
MTRRPLSALWLLLALAAAPSHGSPPTSPAPTASPPAPSATLTVRAQPLAEVAVYPTRSVSAQVAPRNEARIAAEVGGVLQRWDADVGTRVRAGQVLARLDETDLALAVERARAARDAAQARLGMAQAQLARARQLQAQGFLSPEALTLRETELTVQQADLAQTEAALRSAERQRAKAVVRAPFAGTITQRLAQQGETVAAGTPLFVLAQTEGSELHAALPPADAQTLQRVRELVFEAESGAQRRAQVLRVVDAVSAGTRLQTVRLRLLGEPLPPGTPGLLRWQTSDPHVPATLLVQREGRLGVFVAEGEGAAARARFVPLTQAQEGRPAPATGLPTQARLVTQGQQALRDGQPITVGP